MNNKYIIAVILVLGFLRGSLYALTMPPWGLLDEEQHFDYIVKILKQGAPPVVGKEMRPIRMRMTGVGT